VPTEPRRSRNTRTPSLDLDSLYGGGPIGQPSLYEPDRQRLRIESGGLFEDVPRDATGRAIIADPRNDENMMISGLQAAFIKFHNAVVDIVRAERRYLPSLVFNEARRRVLWHYQWILVKEFLPQIIGQSVVSDIMSRGRRHYRPSNAAYMPVEFQGAAYRFGHSMVRPSYRANLAATTPPRSSGWSSTRRPRARPIQLTCAAAPASRAGSSAGRPSSTSATAR